MATFQQNHPIPLLVARQNQDGLGVVLLDAHGVAVGCLGHSPIIATAARLRGWNAFEGGEGWVLGLRPDLAPETLPVVPHGRGWRHVMGLSLES